MRDNNHGLSWIDLQEREAEFAAAKAILLRNGRPAAPGTTIHSTDKHPLYYEYPKGKRLTLS